jgi:hypothetical protein
MRGSLRGKLTDVERLIDCREVIVEVMGRVKAPHTGDLRLEDASVFIVLKALLHEVEKGHGLTQPGNRIRRPTGVE